MAKVIKVAESIRIKCPRETVVNQFEDLDHHNTHQVHPGLRWEVLEELPGRRVIRVGNKTGELFWQGDALVLKVLAGLGKGTTIYHRFQGGGEAETEVAMVLEFPPPPLLGFLAPLFRVILSRALRKGLNEDRLDLEEKGYPR